MQKISLFIFSAILLSSAAVQAASQANKHKMHTSMLENKGMAMQHANPLPNLMKVTMKFGDELALSADQKVEMKKWAGKNGPVMDGLVKKVIDAEKALHTAALGSASQTDLQDLMDKVLSLRLQVAKGKMRCRENMKQVLNGKQWDQLVSIYQQKFM